jgi:DNA (cytosine-5)-methyltransferase 1
MDELIIDSFAGGGGASLGIAWAVGRPPDIAINHDRSAIAMHEKNHPSTRHLLEDVVKADMRAIVGDRSVGMLWASPDCKHFSRAKGAKPVEKAIRSLAWVVVKWAKEIRPRIILLENVREFADWGPLVPRMQCRSCEWRGTEGQAVLARIHRKCPRCNAARLRQLNEMVPDPDKKGVTFKQWVGRLKALGYQVEWRNLNAADYGAPTHRRRLFLVARRDGEPIEWPEPTHCDPKKTEDMPLFGSLKPWRTAAECIDWSIPCPSIFERQKPLVEATLRRIAMGIKRYVLEAETPFIVRIGHTQSEHGYGYSPDMPLTTITSKNEHLLVAPIVSKYHGQKADESRCAEIEKPFNTLDTQPRFALVSAFIAKHFGGTVGVPLKTPLPTTTARGTQNQVVAANIVHFNHGDKQWDGVDEPLRTVTSNNHAALVYSFLIRYFGTSIGQHVTEPLYTITGKDRFGLVVVQFGGEKYVIVDIGMRMLTPRELARAQGFPDTYELTGTKTSQVARIGNSVVPQVAKAVVEANYKGAFCER